jgi:hypothetical protein
MLKLWGLCDPSPSVSCNSAGSDNVSLIGEFASCFGNRILCLDASFEKEVFVSRNFFSFLMLFGSGSLFNGSIMTFLLKYYELVDIPFKLDSQLFTKTK